MPANVVVRDLRKCYGRLEAVRQVSFAVEPGAIFGLLGPNGAGKTTTIECLVGLREPDSGAIEIGGLDARRQPRAVRQIIGVALQATALQDAITPREALRLFGAFYRRRVDPGTLLDRFALAEKADRPFRTLSGGQRQRLALALACVNRPALLVLDEPTAGLDPQARRDLHAEIRRMKREGCTVLISTHYLEEAEQLCDHLAIIDRGRIVATGAPRDLISQSSALQSVTLVTDRPFDSARLAQMAGVTGLRCEEKVARFRTENATRLLPGLSAWLDEQGVVLVELQVRKASLEDVFLALTHAAEGPNPPSP